MLLPTTLLPTTWCGPVLAIGLLLAAAARAQDPAPEAGGDKVVCRMCESRGSHPCGKHGKQFEHENAPEVTFCSEAAACKACAGALATDCKTCRNTTVEAELQRRRELARDWLDKRRKGLPEVEDRKELVHLCTTHVDLSFSIRPTTVGKTKLDTHTLAHLYAKRLEDLRTLYLQTFEIPDADMPTRLQIYMFRDAMDHSRVGPRVTGIGTGGTTGVKLMGPEYIYSMWQDLRVMPDDEALFRNLVHNVTHLLLCNAQPQQFLANRKAGWIDEGVAHWFEDKLTGKCTNFCFEEVLLQAGAGFKGGRWRAPVRRMVDAGEGISFAELSLLNTDQLEFADHALAFAYVDFLITTRGGARFRELIALAKRDQPMRDALAATYGLSPLTIEEPFRQWVKETYSLQDPR